LGTKQGNSISKFDEKPASKPVAFKEIERPQKPLPPAVEKPGQRVENFAHPCRGISLADLAVQ